MVTSASPVSGSSALRRPMLKYGPASSEVFVGAGSSRRTSSGARMTTCWHGAFARSTSTGARGWSSASSRSNGRRPVVLLSSSAVRSRLARTPTTTGRVNRCTRSRSPGRPASAVRQASRRRCACRRRQVRPPGSPARASTRAAGMDEEREGAPEVGDVGARTIVGSVGCRHANPQSTRDRVSRRGPNDRRAFGRQS